MFTVARGVFGPLPSAGGREPHHLLQQVRPEMLSTRPLSPEDSADQAVVGGPAPVSRVRQSSRSGNESINVSAGRFS